MNRRGFISTLGTVLAGFSILPAATTYARNWKVNSTSGIYVPNPDYISAPYEIAFYWVEGSGLHPIKMNEAGAIVPRIIRRDGEPWRTPFPYRIGWDGKVVPPLKLRG